MEANLQKAHGIRVILHQGLKIEEEDQEEHNQVMLQQLRKTTIDKAFFGSGAKVQQVTPITHEEVEDKSD